MITVIGLTGGIGAGKSVVSRILRLKGYAVYDCDSRAKALMECSESIKRKLTSRFGEDCLFANGSVNRKMIAEIVFGKPDELAWLNSVMHKAVRDDVDRWLSEHEGKCFVESAILQTSGLASECGEIWVVEAPEDIRVERALSRGGIDKENILLRIKAQEKEFHTIDHSKKKTIFNYGNHSLLSQINLLLEN